MNELILVLAVLPLLRCGVLVLNGWLFPVLKPNSLAPGKLSLNTASVAMLIPARNEAHNLKQTLAGVLAQPAQEIWVLDDHSTDLTAQVVQQAAQLDPRLRLLAGQNLPAGWMGKNWACYQLAQATQAQILLFLDADVQLKPGALEALLPHMQNHDLLSVFPKHTTLSFAERVLVPLIDVVLLGGLPYPLLKTRFVVAAAANGQVMVFKRAAYEQIGGHYSVKNQVLEDVRLAQRVKAHGLRLGVALGGTLIGVRMYQSYSQIAEGFGKNLTAFHGGSRVLLVVSALLHFGVYTLPWLLWWQNPAWLLLGLLGIIERLLTNHKTGRPLWEAMLVPLAPLMAGPIYAKALARNYSWKGRRYLR